MSIQKIDPELESLWAQAADLSNHDRSDALSELSQYLWSLDELGQAIQVSELRLQSIDGNFSQFDWLDACFQLANQLLGAGSDFESLKVLGPAIQIAREVEDHHSLSYLFWVQARVLWNLDVQDASLLSFSDALASFESDENLNLQARVRFEFAEKLVECGLLDEALQQAAAVISYHQEASDLSSVARAMGLMGRALSDKGHLMQAGKYFTEAIAVYRFLGEYEELQYALWMLGLVQADMGNSVGALRNFDEALEMKQNTAQQLVSAKVYFQKAKLLEECGSLEDSKQIFQNIAPVLRLLGCDELADEADAHCNSDKQE
jgi:tetratricopeptide (TPR) repeat protein